MKKITLLTLAVMLVAVTGFAQDSDEEKDIEGYVGFQYNIDMADGETKYIPSFSIGARQYLVEVSNELRLGYAAMVSVGFISEMNWGGQKVTSSMADYMINGGVLGAGSLNFQVNENIGFVADLGIAFNMDIVSYSILESYYGYTYNYTYDFTTMNIGLGSNLGFQFRLPVQDFSLVFELGANIGYYFWQDYSVDVTVTDGSGNSTKQSYSAGSNDTVNTFRFAPYLLVGISF